MSVVETPFQLKHTNVSRPRLSHSESQQSIAASEGYYSLHSGSEVSTSESDDRSSKPTPGRKYHTPPSHHRTPAQSHEQLQQQAEAPITSLKGVGIPRQHPPHPEYTHNPPRSPDVSTIAEERPDTKEGMNRNSQQRADIESDSLATTPGMDETPYIRFAIDQLTRDEEVRGSRLYPQTSLDEDYPVERIVSDDGLGYLEQEQERERRQSRPPPQKLPKQMSTRAPPKDIFVPHNLPHAPLRFLPGILRPVWLGLLIFLCLLMLAGLLFSAVYSNRNGGFGLWDYMSFGDARYFVFEYLPTMCGMVILMWLFQVQIALQRVAPFISMASEHVHKRNEAVFLKLYPMQFLLPKLEYFRANQPVIGTFYAVSWLFLWTIPLLASSFNVRYDLDRQVWRWLAVQGVIYTVVALYILLIITLLVLMIFLIRNQTGLKWDPRSLADIVTLLERSNVLSDYTGTETFTKSELRQALAYRSDRIGYWSTTRRPNDYFYGIGEEGGETRRYSLEDGRIREKGPEPARAPQRTQQQGDFSIRMDIRDAEVRLRYLPWYLRDTSVVAWIVISIILLIAFYVISYVNSAVRLGYLPQVTARTNTAGFSASNFLYSFIPALIGQFLFLVILTFDYSIRTLRPYISLSSKGGATAETSLLLDYSSRLPLSVTAAALENKHFQTAILSLISLSSVALPILAGGCFWTQYYPNADVVRVAADLPGYYALCFFLALYVVGILVLLPSRRRAALPHRSSTLAEIISWVYQSPILTDRAFARPQTKPELVARLMGTAYLERRFAQSLTSLIRPSRNNLRDESPAKLAEEKRQGKQRQVDSEKRNSVLEPGKIRYGFGIHVGRDGLEHLGIDRVRRGGERSGRELVIFEEQQQRRRSWATSA